MGYLLGLKEYLDEAYAQSVFDQALDSKQTWGFHLHGDRVIRAKILENLTYDLKIDIEGQGEEDLPKIQVKLLYLADLTESVRPLIKMDKKIKTLGLSAILAPHWRYFIKNKSLFSLMKEKQVIFFTLLEGEIIRGIITGFSRYDIAVSLRGGMPATILRHSVYDVKNKKGRCFLKSVQEKYRDWEKSDLFMS